MSTPRLAYVEEMAAAQAAHEEALRAAEAAAQSAVSRAEAIRLAGTTRAEAIRTAGLTRAEALRDAQAGYEKAVGEVGHTRAEDLLRVRNQYDESLREATVSYEAVLLRGATEGPRLPSGRSTRKRTPALRKTIRGTSDLRTCSTGNRVAPLRRSLRRRRHRTDDKAEVDSPAACRTPLPPTGRGQAHGDNAFEALGRGFGNDGRRGNGDVLVAGC